MDFEMFGEDSMMEGVAQRKVDSIAKPEKGSINQMNKKEFWQTIESVNRMVPDGNHEMVVKQMCEELLRYSPQDILDWHLILREYNRAAYRNDLWAACTALGAHASDDGFVDFRTWLISQGKNIYMDAMRDPDTLAANPHTGKEMNFEAFGSCAIDAYRKKLNLTDRDRFMKPYDDLDKHELSDQLVKDIQSEIPQHPDASSICLPRDYSAQFPHIWERMSAQSPGVSATKDAPDLARSTHRIFKINDLFGQQVALQPRVELYSVRDFMGQEMPGLAIVLDEVNNTFDGNEQYAVLTVSFGEFIGAKDCAYIDTNNCYFAPQLLVQGIAEDTGLSRNSGFCQYPLWHFKEDFLKEIGGAAYEEYSCRYSEYMQSAGFGDMEDEDEGISSEKGMVME